MLLGELGTLVFGACLLAAIVFVILSVALVAAGTGGM